MTNLTLSNGIKLNITPAADPRIKDSFGRDGFVRVLTHTQKGARELVREYRAWGADVAVLGTRCLKVLPS